MTRTELKEILRKAGCAEEHGDFVFLCDPRWGRGERDALALAVSGLVRGTTATPHGWLAIPTGGTSGGVRFALHDEETLTAAARGFAAHFGIERVNAVDVLPAHHVSGLMARVRSRESGGEHLAWEWKRLEAGHPPELDFARGAWVISLVPTQLQRLLAWPDMVSWLRRFQIVFIGGGPIWPDLAEAAAAENLRVSLSYGMTETAAMVAALQPEEFLAGERSCGRALPHVQLALDKAGVITIAGASLFRGYFPDADAPRSFTTEDLGRIDERGYVHVLGRRDAAIITGGKKVNPAEVEAALRTSGEFEDVAVIGVPDPEWGEAVVACYPDSNSHVPNIPKAVAALAPHQRPKRFVGVAEWPRNAQGKLNRAALLAAVNRTKSA